MPVLMSLTYLATALVLLALSITIYIWTTPYRELALVREGNLAAALSLGGATLGQALPIGSAIFFTHDLIEMLLWAAIGCAMQLVLFQIMRKYAQGIQEGNAAVGILLACLSISTGLLVATCIS
jgi:putative membrane protein